jgi:hypothetical protein
VTEQQIRARVDTLMRWWLRGVTEGGRWADLDQIAAVRAITERRVRAGTA